MRSKAKTPHCNSAFKLSGFHMTHRCLVFSTIVLMMIQAGSLCRVRLVHAPGNSAFLFASLQRKKSAPTCVIVPLLLKVSCVAPGVHVTLNSSACSAKEKPDASFLGVWVTDVFRLCARKWCDYYSWRPKGWIEWVNIYPRRVISRRQRRKCVLFLRSSGMLQWWL